MFAQALAPAAGAWLLEWGGTTAALAALEGLAVLNVLTALALVPAARRGAAP
jgi:hypothetical protein